MKCVNLPVVSARCIADHLSDYVDLLLESKKYHPTQVDQIIDLIDWLNSESDKAEAEEE